MAKILTLLLSCFTLTLFGQTTNESLPNEIKTTRLPNQVNIPGTRVYIVPPSGFKPSQTLPAIEKNNSAFIQALDLVGGSFYTNAATFTKERFEQKGIKVLEYKELKVNRFPAKMVLILGANQTKVYNLVFGDSTFSTMVTAIFSPNDTQTGEQVKQAICSIYYDKATQVNPFANASFKLDDSKSIFKFASFTANMYIYSIGGVKKQSYAEDARFMVFSVPTEGTTLQHTANKTADIIKESNIKNISEQPTNGAPSLKREVYGKLNGKPALLFQHIVLLGQNTVIMQGVATEDFKKYISEFEKLSNTITGK